jgi:HD superfamily phosphohydrolase
MKPRARPTLLRDPVHGDIELSGEEVALIDTPEFQRLRGIKQLGTSYLVYPGATHSRFEHSIGTMHMTSLLLGAVNKHATLDPDEYRAVSAEEIRVLRFAALLHDATHIPFGHNLEDQTGLLPRHDRPERFAALLAESELGRRLRAFGAYDEVLAILGGGGGPPFRAQALSDTIDADLLDYLRRDAYYTGLDLRYDSRITAYFRIERSSERMFVDCEKNGMLREDIVSEMLRVLEARYHFSERVYYHHAKVAAGALVARMVEVALRSGRLSAEDLQRSTDQSLLDLLGRLDVGSSADTTRLRRFVDRFSRRELPKRVLVLPAYLNGSVQETLLERYFATGRPEARFAWETEMEAAAAREFGREIDVIMYCPRKRMQLKEAATLVRFPGSGERILPLRAFAGQIPRLLDLEQGYPRLWKLYVFCSDPDRDVRRRLQRLCLERLPAECTNALRL